MKEFEILTIEDEIEVPVQINGKLKTTVTVAKDISEEEIVFLIFYALFSFLYVFSVLVAQSCRTVNKNPSLVGFTVVNVYARQAYHSFRTTVIYAYFIPANSLVHIFRNAIAVFITKANCILCSGVSDAWQNYLHR